MTSKLEEVQFPLDSFKEAAPLLRRPFSPGAVRWKVQSTAANRGLIVGYIDARLVIERLNLVVPHLWFDSYERLDGTALRCALTVDGITREDVGIAKDAKALYSDALKRAAVKFGIGVSLYAMKATWLDVGEGKGKLKKVRSGSKDTLVITPDTETWLRENYAAWLKLEDRGATFGPPLNHGDDPEGSVGELADTGPEQQKLDVEAFDEQRAAEQKTEIRAIFDSAKGNGRRALTKGSVDAMIAGATSHQELEAVKQHVAAKLGVQIEETA